MAIEGRGERKEGRQDQAGDGRRRRGRLHRRRPPHRLPHRRPVRTRRRRAVVDAREGAPFGRGARPRRRTASTTTTRAWRRPKPSAPDGIEAVAIVTPNNVHAGPTYAFLKAGIHVICDKPLTVSLAEAKKMRAAVEKSGLVFALTHNYTGYPLVRRMREMVRARRTRRDPPRPGRISAGLADRGDRSHRQQAGGMARRSEALGRGRLARRHRHPRL